MLGRIVNGNLEKGLPISGILMDGRTVSNYDLLPIDTLIAEGWKPLVMDYSNGAEYIESVVDMGENITLIFGTEVVQEVL